MSNLLSSEEIVSNFIELYNRVNNNIYYSSSYDTLALALTYANNKTLVIDSSINITSNTTIPYTVSIVVIKGGMFNISENVTLTISGSFQCGMYQCFNYESTTTSNVILTNVSAIYPEWFGAKVNDSIDSSISIQSSINCALNSLVKHIKCQNGIYKLSNNTIKIWYNGRTNLTLEGNTNTIFEFDNESNPDIYIPSISISTKDNTPLQYPNRVMNVIIKNLNLTRIRQDTRWYYGIGITCHYYGYIQFINCIFTNFMIGLQTNEGSELQVVNCEMYMCNIGWECSREISFTDTTNAIDNANIDAINTKIHACQTYSLLCDGIRNFKFSSAGAIISNNAIALFTSNFSANELIFFENINIEVHGNNNAIIANSGKFLFMNVLFFKQNVNGCFFESNGANIQINNCILTDYAISPFKFNVNAKFISDELYMLLRGQYISNGTTIPHTIHEFLFPNNLSLINPNICNMTRGHKINYITSSNYIVGNSFLNETKMITINDNTITNISLYFDEICTGQILVDVISNISNANYIQFYNCDNNRNSYNWKYAYELGITNGNIGEWTTQIFENTTFHRKMSSVVDIKVKIKGIRIISTTMNNSICRFAIYTSYNNVIKMCSDSQPSLGTWYKNDIVYNSNYINSSNLGWICTSDGNPGNWKSF